MQYTKFSQGLRRLCSGLAMVFAVVILVKSLTPTLPSIPINHADKYLHVLAYLALGAVALPAFAHIRPLFVWLGVVVFGGGVEVLQGVVNTGRAADIYDGIANAFGALLAIGIWQLISKVMARSSRTGEDKSG